MDRHNSMDSTNTIHMDGSKRPTKQPNNKNDKRNNRLDKRKMVTQNDRLDMIILMRGVQLVLITLVMTSILGAFIPALAWGNAIAAILGLYFEWKIEKNIKKRKKEIEQGKKEEGAQEW